MAINPNERFNRVTVGRGRSANRNRTRGSGSSAGVFNPKFLTNLNRQNNITPRGGRFLQNAGQALANRRTGDPGKYGAEDLQFNIDLGEDVFRKTTPDLNYVGGTNRFVKNPDGSYSINASLSDREQEIYDQSGMLTTNLGNLSNEFFKGGYDTMHQNRLDRLRALYTEEDAIAKAELLARNQATGASSTARALGEQAYNRNINQRDLGLIAQADTDVMNYGNFLMNNRGTALDQMIKTGNIANDFISNQMNFADADANLSEISKAKSRQLDQIAAAEEAERKSKSNFWGGIFNAFAPAISNAIIPGSGTAMKAIGSGLFKV